MWRVVTLANGKQYEVVKGFGRKVSVYVEHVPTHTKVCVSLFKGTFTLTHPRGKRRPPEYVVKRVLRTSANLPPVTLTHTVVDPRAWTQNDKAWMAASAVQGDANVERFVNARFLGTHLAGMMGDDVAHDVLAAFLSVPPESAATRRRAPQPDARRKHDSIFVGKPVDATAVRRDNVEAQRAEADLAFSRMVDNAADGCPEAIARLRRLSGLTAA